MTRGLLVVLAASLVSGCGRDLSAPFVASLPAYLALTSARDAHFETLSPAGRALLEQHPEHKHNVRDGHESRLPLRGPFVVVDPAARRIHPWFSRLPDDLRAPDSAAVKAVVWVTCTEGRVGSYTSGKKAVGSAYRETCELSFFDLPTRSWLGDEHLIGGSPPETIVNRTSATGPVPYTSFERALRRRLERGSR